MEEHCIVQWYRNAFTMCPWKPLREVVAMLKAVHTQEDNAAARQKAALVAEKLRSIKLERISLVETSVEETLSYMDFPYGAGCGQITVSNASVKRFVAEPELSAAFRMGTRL